MDAVRPDEHDDPVAAVRAARTRGAMLSLPTSGTSGPTARRVLRSTESWWVTFDAYSDLTGVSEGVRVWVPGPSTSTMVLFARVHAAVCDARLVASPADATHACLTPARLARDAGALPRGTVVTVAGASLSPAAWMAAARHGLELRHYYGAAELSFVAAGTTGEDLRAFPGVEIDIRPTDAAHPTRSEDHADELPDGERATTGEIWVRSAWVCDGYDGPPGSLRRDPHGWATVGDLGALRGDGVLTVHGRPDTVTTGGATVLLADVEAALVPRAGGPIAVHGIPHPTLGEVVAVALTDARDRESLEPYARAHLSAAQRPRVWRVVPELPLTAAGKVDRARLARDAAR
ncbi:O-succinylbenzoate-CoA ligase [Nostocoides japonicum T1-X7]|uniref:O-succinylbenzoate-CoA ligase n=1 Tax=Nostocoides japonicum T1-X7 TaxID=1194083 RepID=A0A077LZR2_9MICO|nr:AMP-binding protein [Tetrasphaera japonica]CCH77434.1 O-succinylbenzoate-CoA ligase [Tetrasphaera japonica T1-X7]